ncbi:MAG: pyridoxamine 5'-phosphate oxidase family protein [Streptomycetaceae bacterium]|nr:pyridoxamine 5'-phosphate oxidase family protein [Streptomycetaceae bacterium]
MTTTPPVLQELTAEEALRLMARAPVGRVVFTERALPAIRPVHFTLHAGSVVFRILADPRLAAALHGSVVTVQTDEYDADRVSGWSVTATGRALRVTDADEVARLVCHMPPLWEDAGDHVFAMTPELMTGRRVVR